MNPLSALVLAASCSALPWAMRRGLAEIGDPLRCDAVDSGVLVLGSIAGAVCAFRGDVAGAVLCASCGLSCVTDIRRGVVLDTVLAVTLTAIAILALSSGRLPGAVLGCAATLSAMGLVFAAGRGAMGLGDVKFAGVIGAAFGTERGLITLAIAFVLGGAVAAVLLASGRVRRGQALPFAPYLAIAVTVVACGIWPFEAGG